MTCCDLIKKQIAAKGYAVIKVDEDRESITVAAEIGQTITPWEGGLVQELIPRAAGTPNTYSGIYGLDRFPFHTDLAHWHRPPRYLMLRCVRGYADVSTQLLDGEALVERVKLNVLARAIVKPRRPQGGSVPLLRLCEKTDTGYRLRWDEVFLEPASKVGDLASQHMRECLANSEPQSISLTLPGDMLLIDNWRMLHARSPIPPGREDRKIERIFLERLN
jgi:L-asparagine oxygenase